MKMKTEKGKKLAGLLCVIGPVAAIALMLLGKGGGFGSYALFLLCPLSHLLMMPMMHKMANGQHDAHATPVQDNEKPRLSLPEANTEKEG